MPGEFRVKESCAPCKKRKSKCDAQQPCASCILRNTQDRCQYANGPSPTGGNLNGADRRLTYSGDHRSSPYPARIGEVAESSSAPTKRAMSEIMKLKMSIHHLEGHVRELSHLENGVQFDDEPATAQEKENWAMVLANIPGKAVVEILLEYLIQECDWLWQGDDVLAVWQRAVRRGGASASQAGLMCISLALPAYILGSNQTTLYRLPVDTAQLHGQLFDLSRSFAVTDIRTLDDIAHYLAMVDFQVFSGRHDPYLLACSQAGARAVRDLGWTDEGKPVWTTLDTETRERARQLVLNIIRNYQWAIMGEHVPNILEDCRVNLCLPRGAHPYLSGPLDLALPGDAEVPFRIFRVVSKKDQQRTVEFVNLWTTIDKIVVDVRSYKERLDRGYLTAADKTDLVTTCQAICNNLVEMRDHDLPRTGLEIPDDGTCDISDPAMARKAAMTLILDNAIGFLLMNMTRHWLVNNSPTSPAEQVLQDLCLDTANRSIKWMEISKQLVTTRAAPFVSAFTSANLFNAATVFTVPVLRAVKLWTNTDRDADVRSLPSLPDSTHHEPFGRRPESATRESLPATIYIDHSIRSYANSILLILDTLKALSVSPLGEETEKRLEMLIQNYGLRDSRNYDVAMPPPASPTGWSGSVPTWPLPLEGEGVDPMLLNQLLLMDGNIWQGLLNRPNGAG